jgi:hypothetical protein
MARAGRAPTRGCPYRANVTVNRIRRTTMGTEESKELARRYFEAGNKDVSMTGISIVRVANGKVVEERIQADIMGMMQQLGLIPSPDPARA